MSSCERSTTEQAGLLNGIRIVECTILLSGSVTTMLSDLGADIVKVEHPNGDPITRAVPPLIGNTTLMDLHVNRGKRRVSLDLSTDDDRNTFLTLLKDADAVIEAMKPGLFDRWGLTPEILWKANPRLVILRVSTFGTGEPYSNLPTHGTACDAWAGLLPPQHQHYVPIGITAGPMIGALALLSGVLNARARAQGCELDVAHADVAAWFGWQHLEEQRLRRTGVIDGGAPATAEFEISVGHRVYRTFDNRRVLLMAPEPSAWKRFCGAAGCPQLLDLPTSDVDDHQIVAAVEALFLSRTAQQWMSLAREQSLPLVPVNHFHELADDPQFLHRTRWIPACVSGAEVLATPIRVGKRFAP